MSFQSYATLETLMHQRISDRLREAEQQRLVDAAEHAHANRRPRAGAALRGFAIGALRYVSALA